MRQIAMALTVVLALSALTGCSASAKSKLPERREFVTLGSQAVTTGVEPPKSGLDANSVPQAAIKGLPGGSEIVVASGMPAVTRDQAIEKARPSDGRLVSAVDVVLPTVAMRAILGDPKKAEPATVWVVTWTGVTQRSSGPAGKGKTGRPAAGRVRHGDTSVFVDATTGETLAVREYPTGQ